MLKVGAKVTWIDDGVESEVGHVVDIIPAGRHCATHKGALYVCRFPLGEGYPSHEWYERSFDSLDIGVRLKEATG